MTDRSNKPSQRRSGGTPGHVRAEWAVNIAGIRIDRCAQAQYVLASALVGTALGRRQLNHGLDAEAELAYQRTLPWAEQLDPRAEKTLLYVLNGLGIAEYDQEKFDSAEKHFRRGGLSEHRLRHGRLVSL